jgi:hypothetical protein
MLGSVHSLDISNTNISDVGSLGGVYELNLNSCYNIRNVSSLGGVYSLALFECSNISDVSSLGGVHNVLKYKKIIFSNNLKNVI